MPVRIIQVGMGSWGQNWARSAVPTVQDVEAAAWVEVVEETLQTAQTRLALPPERCFTTLEAALVSVQADAVLITASLPGHVPVALNALNAGKHVLVEKPFAPGLAEARRLVDLAASKGLTLMVSQNYRFYPAVRAAADLVREKVLGEIGSVSLDFRHYDNTAPVESYRHYHIWEPLLVDMSIHHFDLMRMVLGQEPTRISCTTWNPPWSHFVEAPSGSATIAFNGGAVVNYRGSWVSPGPTTNWAGEWRIECEQGEIVWTSRGEHPDQVVLRPLGKRSRSVKLPQLDFVDRSGSLYAFAQAILNGSTPECSGSDNYKTLALMLAAVESSQSGRPVEIFDGSGDIPSAD